MPVLQLHFPKDMVDHDKFEDVLSFLNKIIEDSNNHFKSRSSWMRHVLRTYAILSNNNRRRWETNKTMIIDGRTVDMPGLIIWNGEDIDKIDDGQGGELVGLPIGDLQFEYLKRAVEWENTFQLQILNSGRTQPNVARLAHSILFGQLLTLWAQVDEAKMRLEEAALDDLDSPSDDPVAE